MESKIMNIFYGADNLPYKDAPRTVHFPVVGQAFMGASNTTEIRFYIDKIGSIDATYISIAKLPNGKVGTKILTKGYDAQIDENYVSLRLSNFYTQAKGDLYISLNGYEGGVELRYNEETELYEIYGTPTIQATGSVKIAINYATQYVGDGTEETITLQEIYALFGAKLDKDSPYYIKAIEDINDINNPIYTPYLKGNQIVYSKSDNGVYRIVELEGTLSATKLPSAVDCLKLDGSTPMEGDLNLGYHNIVNTLAITSGRVEAFDLRADQLSSRSTGTIRVVDEIDMSNKKIKNVAEPTLGTDVATKSYVDEHSGRGEVVDVKINGNTIVDSNKVANINLKNDLDNATHNDIASALATKNAIDNVREVAEGKTKAFSVFVSQNPQFNSREDFIQVDTFTDVEGNEINVRDLKMGDTIYTVDSGDRHYLDRFVIATGDTVLGAINADTPDLQNYYKKNEDLIPSANDLNVGSADHPYATLFADQVYDYRSEQKVFVEDIIHKKVLCELTYDGSHILDAEGHILGFADIKQLLDDAETYVYINDLTNKSMLNFGAYEDDALWFNSRYKIDGENYLVRLIINAQDQIQHDEDIAVNYHNAYTWAQPQTFNGGIKVVGNLTNGYNQLSLAFANGQIMSNQKIVPMTNNNFDLGDADKKWKDLYLSGTINGANNVFNIINASDISSATLTDEQYTLITNGKPTLIKGTWSSYTDFLLLPPRNNITYFEYIIIDRYRTGKLVVFNNKTIQSSTASFIHINNVERINDKLFPAYSKGVLAYDGTNLSWKDGQLLYKHSIQAVKDSETFNITLISNIATALNTEALLGQAYLNGKIVNCYGVLLNGATTENIVNCVYVSNMFGFCLIDATSQSMRCKTLTNFTITDVVENV